MEQTPLPPLLSEQMRRLSSRMGNAEAYAIIQGFAADVEAIEADRAKTREVVQALVDALDEMKDAFEIYASCQCDGTGCPVCRKLDKADNALYVAESMKIKPSRP